MKLWGFGKTSVAITILLGSALLVAVAGWVGDMLAEASMSSLNEKSLEYFAEFQEVGYRKPAYHRDMQGGEAWDMYARALALLEMSDKRGISLVTGDFLSGLADDSARVALILAETDSVIACIKQGVRAQRSTGPLNYAEGHMAQLPEFMGLRTASMLLACRARLVLGEDPGSATEDMIDGAIFAQDLAGGDLTLLGHFTGLVCLNISTNEIHRALGRFALEDRELERIAWSMNTLANSWPPLSGDLDGEWRMTAISLSKYGERATETLDRFAYWWVTHLLSWRSFFSYRRSQLGALDSYRVIAQDLADAEARGWGAVDSAVRIWEQRLREGDWVAHVLTPCVLGMPGVSSQYRRRFEGIAKVRLAGTGALLELHFLRNGRWPEDLTCVRQEGSEDLLVDPMTGGLLRYMVYPGADSVAVHSAGANMVDDGGVRTSECEKNMDIVLVLRRPQRS